MTMKVLKQGVDLFKFIYFQYIYRCQILFQLTIRLVFHKQQDLCQTSGWVNNIAECPTLNKTEMLKEGNMHSTDKWHYIKLI